MERFRGYSITGRANNDYAPRNWTLRCDGVLIDRQAGYAYTRNRFLTCLPQSHTCASLQLSIVAWYGASPSIRTFGLYRPVQPRPILSRLGLFSAHSYRHSLIPGHAIAAVRERD